MVMGTPFYMSPEQASGDRNLDARVDLYACGVILYEAITGKRPFTAANYNALPPPDLIQTSPRPARELRPALPQGFDEVLDKGAGAKEPRRSRFQSAAEFQREAPGRSAIDTRRPSVGMGHRRPRAADAAAGFAPVAQVTSSSSESARGSSRRRLAPPSPCARSSAPGRGARQPA